jgi:FlaA1/EpsC-like NDP-sugar epimerase
MRRHSEVKHFQMALETARVDSARTQRRFQVFAAMQSLPPGSNLSLKVEVQARPSRIRSVFSAASLKLLQSAPSRYNYSGSPLPQNSNDRRNHVPSVQNVIADYATGYQHVAGETILLTGAGGSIGSALAKEILSAKPRQLLLLDHSEQALYDLGRFLSDSDHPHSHQLVLGDFGDAGLVAALLDEQRPDLILHAAAYKHVPLMEANPFVAVQNNAILTWQLAKMASEAGVPQLLLISTDKAANPRSILGVSKRVAEQAVLRWNAHPQCYAAIRLVNVLGSTGSVVPLFLEQIARGGPLTVSHPDASRHFMTLEDTVRLILIATALPQGRAVYVPRLSEPLNILQLAKELLRCAGRDSANSLRVEFTGLRPGEKLTEDILNYDEYAEPTSHPAIQMAVSPQPSADELDRQISRLKEAIECRRLPALLETLCRLVPQYQPGSTLCSTEQTTHE